MKLKDSLGGMLIIVTLFLSSPGFTQQTKGSSNQVGVNKPEIYYFGLQANAPPISNNNGLAWKGYCYAYIEALKKSISEKIEIVSVKTQHRFTGEGDNGQKLDAECGPNTITPERKQDLRKNDKDGQFSVSFAWTRAKVLLPNKKIPDFSDPSKLKELKFGVLGGTTTKNLVASLFPSVEQKNIVLLKDRQDAITNIKEKKIDAFFNDELLLKSVLKELQSSNNAQNYSILSIAQYAQEEYGIIVYHVSKKKNKNLLNTINNLLKQGEVKKIGDTEIQILKNQEFDKVIEDLKPPVKPSENGHNFSLLEINYIFWGFLSLLVIILIIFINNQINRARTSRGISQTRTQRNNNSDNRNNEESRVASSKSEYSPATPHIIVYTHNNLHSKNHNTQGDNMPDAPKYDIKGNIGNIIDTAQPGSHQQSIQHNYAAEQKQDLAEAARQIQALLKQLEETNPTITDIEKLTVVSKAAEEIKKDPTLKARVIAALKSGGTEAFKEAIDHPLVNILVAIIQGWQEAE